MAKQGKQRGSKPEKSALAPSSSVATFHPLTTILSVNGEVDQEKLAMRKRIIELEMENEILKKAAVIFSRSG
jgi:transposase-like protein